MNRLKKSQTQVPKLTDQDDRVACKSEQKRAQLRMNSNLELHSAQASVSTVRHEHKEYWNEIITH
jgi:hypothetical protein